LCTEITPTFRLAGVFHTEKSKVKVSVPGEDASNAREFVKGKRLQFDNIMQCHNSSANKIDFL